METLPPTDGRYAFVFPTVVGSRFVAAGSDSWDPSSGDGSSLVTNVTLRMQPSAAVVSSSVGLALTQIEEPDATVVTTTAAEMDCVVEFELTSEAVEASIAVGGRVIQTPLSIFR